MSEYLAFYKPDEVLCQFTDQGGRPTMKLFINVPGVYAAGRLDYHSEGLVLLSDDGLFIQRVSDPRFAHPKTYWVQVEGLVTPEAVEQLNRQVVLPGLQTRLPHVVRIPPPAHLPPRPRPVRAYHPTSWLELTLFEGKKHQVRRMTAAVGFPTLRLVRWAIGPVTLLGLLPAGWRSLSASEITVLRSAPWAPRLPRVAK